MQLIAVTGIAEVMPGQIVSDVIADALQAQQLSLEQGDVVVVAQKIISKAEGRYAYLKDVEASAEAVDLAQQCDKDPRLVQLILDESEEVLRVRPGVIIVQHKQGYVHANAGIDKSNLVQSDQEQVLLLPENCKASAEQLSGELATTYQTDIAVIINDSAGRAWRNGTCGMAIGTAGFNPLIDLIGTKDRVGRIMEVSQVAVADELAAAASFIMGQGAEGVPVVVIKGANIQLGAFDDAVLIRDKSMDMFR